MNGTFTAPTTTWSNQPPTSIIDADGVTYDTSTTYEEDPNGNKITESGTTITDSLGRQIPLPPTSKSSSNTSHCRLPCSASGCTAGILCGVLWSVPGPNGVMTEPYKFCYATVTMNIPPNLGLTPNQGFSGTPTKLQSIVLPNSQTWNFTYNDPGDGSTYNGLPINYGSLSQITLPTGGTISYLYTTETQGHQCRPSGDSTHCECERRRWTAPVELRLYLRHDAHDHRYRSNRQLRRPHVWSGGSHWIRNPNAVLPEWWDPAENSHYRVRLNCESKCWRRRAH